MERFRSWQGIAMAGLVALLALVSCIRPPTFSSAQLGTDTAAGTTLTGHVDFGLQRQASFTTQATMSDVANSATVTLIDQASGHSIATTLTDASGNFNLTLPNFTPATSSYYLEAYKGLNNNAAASSSIRVRTLLQFVNGGWESMSNTIPNVGITIDVGTTAVSIITSLRAPSTNPVTVQYVGGVSNEVGVINPMTTPASFTPPSTLNISQSEYSSVYNLIDQAFADNIDPVYAIAYNVSTGGYLLNTGNGSGSGTSTLPAATGISPTSAAVGGTFTVAGTNFDPTLANDKVFFGAGLTSLGSTKPAIPANLTSGSATGLSGTIPSGALTGEVTAQIDDLILVVPGNFSVAPSISGFSPGKAATGATFTLNGAGFDPLSANDTVQFTSAAGGITATGSIVSASYGTLTVTVPTAAVTGAVTVSTPGGSATSATSFAVVPTISSMNPPAAASPSATVTLYGTGFGATQGSSTIMFGSTSATVISWSDTAIAVTAPATVGTYAVTVTVGGNASAAYTLYVWNWSDGGKTLFDPSGAFWFDTDSTTIYKVASGTTTVGTGTTAASNYMMGLAFGPDGQLWIAGESGGVLQALNLSTGIVTTVSSSIAEPIGLAWSPGGVLYITSGYPTYGVYLYNLSTRHLTLATLASGTTAPTGPEAIVCDNAGNAYFTDSSDIVYKVTPAGVISELLDPLEYPSGITTDGTYLYEECNYGEIIKFGLTGGATSSLATFASNGEDSDETNLSYHVFSGTPYLIDNYYTVTTTTHAGVTSYTYTYYINKWTLAGAMSTWLDITAEGYDGYY